ncbi:hypothetical protein D1872_319300 [compost metagenome]
MDGWVLTGSGLTGVGAVSTFVVSGCLAGAGAGIGAGARLVCGGAGAGTAIGASVTN